MKRALVLATLLDLGLHARPAAAQGPGPADSPIAPFLEKRVPEELAVEGVMLARRNLALQIEPVGGNLLVSLVDLTTGRVAASTKLAELPPDREAAVATVTHVVADLAAQIGARDQPPPAAPAAGDDRAERRAREVADLQFRRSSIRFGASYEIAINRYSATIHRQWIAFQGDLDQELDPVDFYREVGRPDLGDAYDHRRDLMIGGYVVGGLGFAGSLIAAYLGFSQRPSCDASEPFDQFNACLDARSHAFDDYQLPVLGLAAVGAAGMIFGLWYHYNPHPISENDAKSLADDYNTGLRHRLGLPTARRAPLLHDVKLAPYVAARDSGLVLSARF